MQAYAFTDVGLSRSMNQDYVYASTAPMGSLDNLFIVADGMGGHKAGDYASRFVVENLVSFFESRFPDKDIHGILKDGVRRVNRDLGKMKRGSWDYQQKKNIITRAMGTGEIVDVDLFALKLKPGDYILMCSDGLSNMVDEFEIEYVIRTEEELKKRAKTLIESANRNGGKDNISVILIDPQISEVAL